MNYQLHYNLLCDRGKLRKFDSVVYLETHHIVPKCMGGSNDPTNLVRLTPEEHYLAHQLLVKIYPNNKGLVWAAHQMTKLPSGQRSNNKLYGWLKRLNRKVASERVGNKNGSFGKQWYFNPSTEQNIKCSSEQVPDGFINGRFVLKNKYPCVICGTDTGSRRRKYCDTHREERIKEVAAIAASVTKHKYVNDEQYKIRAEINLERGRVTGIKRKRASERRP